MKKAIMILICLVINICAYCNVYSSYEASVEYNKYSTISSSYQYEFKSTSSYAPIVQYQTVKPLDREGFVSIEYTTYKGTYNPRRTNKGLDLDDGDEPTGGLVPIGDPDVYIIALLFLLYILFKRHKENILNQNVG